jgi:serine/threonine-protein kinase
MVMEFLEGGSLQGFLLSNATESVSFEQRTDFVYDIAVGMKYLHQLNIIHRDLKPGNIVMDTNLRLKITDFGLSLQVSKTATSLKVSEEGKFQYEVFYD